jgi:hypothetical protein
VPTLVSIFVSIFRRVLQLIRITVRRSFATSRRSGWVLLLGLALIPAWQATYALNKDNLSRTYRLKGVAGLRDQAPVFYFRYYLGLYPVATTLAAPPMNEEGARQIVEKHGQTLVMETAMALNSALRNGDHLKLLLYLPHALWKGDPSAPSARLANMIGFMLALMGLYTSFWWLGLPLLGAMLVGLLGSNPFQVYEVYVHDNVFGWTITTSIIVLALYLPLMHPRGTRGRAAFLLTGAAGLVLGTALHIRSENALVFASALLATLFMTRLRWAGRAALAATLVATLLLAIRGWSHYFQRQIDHAYEVVEKAGGYPHPHAKAPRLHHAVWFPVWCGLGDFDEKYGYEWLDIAAHRFALKELREKHGVQHPKYADGYYFSEPVFIDARRRYPMLPYDLPGYLEVIRGKVVHDITHDPLWYAEILAKRLRHILLYPTPLKLGSGHVYLFQLRTTGLIFLPMLLVLLACRSRFLLQVLCFTVPISIFPLAIHALGGMNYYSTYHIHAGGILMATVLQGVLWWRRQRSRAGHAGRWWPIGSTEAEVEPSGQAGLLTTEGGGTPSSPPIVGGSSSQLVPDVSGSPR